MKKPVKTTIDLDIRFFRRYPKEIDFIVHIKKEPFMAKTSDYSLAGLGIVIEDSPPVKAGDILDLDINEFRCCWYDENGRPDAQYGHRYDNYFFGGR